jgi:hypothetical protein
LGVICESFLLEIVSEQIVFSSLFSPQESVLVFGGFYCAKKNRENKFSFFVVTEAYLPPTQFHVVVERERKGARERERERERESLRMR